MPTKLNIYGFFSNGKHFVDIHGPSFKTFELYEFGIMLSKRSSLKFNKRYRIVLCPTLFVLYEKLVLKIFKIFLNKDVLTLLYILLITST